MSALRYTALAVSVALALAACAAQPASQSAEPSGAVAGQDQLPRFVGVIGAKEQHAAPYLGVPETNYYRLRSFVDRRTGETLHQLYVSDSYPGPERHWNAARDGAGRPLRFFTISQHEIACAAGCSYVEEFAATIPESELRASPQGLVVVFAAASGAEKRITISAAQIAAQLASVDTRRSPVQPAAAASQPQSPHQ